MTGTLSGQTRDRKVVVTGMGAISACGVGADALWQAAKSGQSGAKRQDFKELTAQKVFLAAPVPRDLVEANKVHDRPRLQDPVSHMALIAADEAMRQAGLGEAPEGARTGVIVGSGFGGADTLDTNYINYGTDPTSRMDPMSIPKIMTNAAASWISMTFGAKGPVYCNSTACSSASQSMGLAYYLVNAGMMDRCITGGAEGCVVPGVFRAWEVMRVLAPEACRPFSRNRNGMMLGEGAGILVIETEEAAKARGATILAELVGYGTSGDAGDLLRPDPEGAARAMQDALDAEGLAADQVGYVNAHGTATVANDVSETEAMRRVFGAHFEQLAVSSTKPIHGHALGAAGALEAIVTIGALQDGLAPPNINFAEEDPKLGFTPVTQTARPFEARYAMSNSFAFGGINASLIFGRPG
jgi:nodulation protein E